MFYINDETYQKLLANAEPVNTADPYGLQKRLDRYPTIRWWDSGEKIGASSGQWEEQARIIDVPGDDLYIEVHNAYYGERFNNTAPEFYRVPRSLYEAAIAAEEQQHDQL